MRAKLADMPRRELYDDLDDLHTAARLTVSFGLSQTQYLRPPVRRRRKQSYLPPGLSRACLDDFRLAGFFSDDEAEGRRGDD
jgi:hypothetical protein